MPEMFHLKFHVNGREREADVWPMERLLDVLRDRLDLKGTKEGCGEGECGACAVLMEGRLVNSCLVPALEAEGRRVTTIEGLAKPELIDAFERSGGVQCGICTPGMVVAVIDALNRSPGITEAETREALAGNLCRCTGYAAIVAAVRAAADRTATRQ